MRGRLTLRDLDIRRDAGREFGLIDVEINARSPGDGRHGNTRDALNALHLVLRLVLEFPQLVIPCVLGVPRALVFRVRNRGRNECKITGCFFEIQFIGLFILERLALLSQEHSNSNVPITIN